MEAGGENRFVQPTKTTHRLILSKHSWLPVLTIEESADQVLVQRAVLYLFVETTDPNVQQLYIPRL